MRFAVICAAGIGDGLITLIASHHLRKIGHTVTTFSSHLPSFGRWLEPGDYRLSPACWETTLMNFDAVLLQHDNTPSAQKIVALRKADLPIYVFYTNYRFSKHGPLLDGFDFVFDHHQTMVDNTCQATQTLFGGTVTANNGLTPLPSLIHRKYDRRVLIHPMSACSIKNWLPSRFLKLSSKLQKMNFQPIFILSPQESPKWPDITAPCIPTLEDLASLIYESGFLIGNDSGPGHLASYLSIPHLIIRRYEKNLSLWQPGWHRGEMVIPPKWLPNFKGLRFREKYWKHFITTQSVLKRFNLIIK